MGGGGEQSGTRFSLELKGLRFGLEGTGLPAEEEESSSAFLQPQNKDKVPRGSLSLLPARPRKRLAPACLGLPHCLA